MKSKILIKFKIYQICQVLTETKIESIGHPNRLVKLQFASAPKKFVVRQLH